jgi:WD40 repeat protein/serine/threonine protein kinase
MTQSYACIQGHRWQAEPSGDPATCPECGGPPQAPVSSDATALSLDAAVQVQPAATVAIDSANKEDSREHTLLAKPVSEATAPAPTAPGYELLDELGRGGMGVVYRARHQRLNRIVALKMILAGAHASGQELLRFRAEAESVALLQHANIVQIYEVGEHDGRPFFSLEFIEGGSLAQRLDGTPQPSRWAAEMIETLARAIHFAHQRGIVHRDLKPANVLLAGGGWSSDSAVKSLGLSSAMSTMQAPLAIPKVTDFGLAKRLEGTAAHTRTGAILGTPSYIAPEQAAGRKDVGPAVDVYALGTILYEMLTGRPPFRGETAMDTMLQVMSDEPVPPCRLQPKVPIDLETICLKCLEKDPKKRYASAEALADDLRRFRANEPIQARPISLPARTLKWALRRPAVAALVAVILLASLALLVGGWWTSVALGRANFIAVQRADEAEEQRHRAEVQARETELQRAVAEQARQIAEQQRQIAQEQLEQSMRALYALQLTQAAALAPRDPVRALELLRDPVRCPEHMHDFTWAYLRGLCDRQRGTLTSPKMPISSLAYSPNGKLLATAGDDDVTLWDTTTWKPQPLPARHAGTVVAIAFTPDGAQLATAGLDKIIRLWDPQTAKELGALQGHEAGVRALAFTPDGKTLASASHDATIRLWDVASRVQRAKLTGHRGAVTSVAFTADAKMLASGGADKTVRLWDPETAKEVGPPLEGHDALVLAVDFAPTGHRLASGAADARIKLWDTDARKELHTLLGHTAAVNALAFTPDGRQLASAGSDRTVKLWQVSSGAERTTLRGAPQSLLTLAFAPDGKTLAVGGTAETIRLWDVQSPEAALKIELGGSETHGPTTAFTPDGRSLAVVEHPGKMIRLWDLQSGKNRVLAQNLTVILDRLAVSPDGTQLAAAADDRTLKLFAIANGQLRATLKGKMARLTGLAFAPDGQTLASGDADGQVKLWDLATGKETPLLARLGGAVGSVAFARMGHTLAATDDNGVHLWNAATRSDLPVPGAFGPVRLLSFSPDGEVLALVSGDGRSLLLWDVAQRRVRTKLPDAGEPIRAAAFSPNGQTLATGHADWSVRLWDTVGGQERAVLTGTPHAIHALTFTADGRTLFAVSDEGHVRYWETGPRPK